VPPEFQLLAYLRRFADHDVDYLIVGGVAGRVQGAATTTQDIDIMPEPSPENLERLAVALSNIETRKKEAGSTTYEPHDIVDPMEFRTADISSYVTRHGVIDVLMELLGVGTYDEVRRRARAYETRGIPILVADIDDVITSKETADRAKDHRALDALYEARDRLREYADKFELSEQQLDVASPPDKGTDEG
jgi:hypothetical protein